MTPQLVMMPSPGGRLLHFVGDRIRIGLAMADSAPDQGNLRAFLRTNLGRGELLRNEILQSHFQKVPLAGASWHDIPMRSENGAWMVDLWLTQTGYFRAKPYAVDGRFRQYWPGGPDLGICVHPDSCRTANTVYCAFVRMFGGSRTFKKTLDERVEQKLKQLDQQGYAVIPASGTLRDLKSQLPHILETLGCRILHLLPVNPAPTTYARFGRFGSPYASQDLTAIDPALVEFDRSTTGIDQFRELAYAVHLRGGRLFLDLAINHTGWGSTLQENHPEWFLRHPDGTFASPGAWGVTWEDLVELEHRHPALWDLLADVFLTWCRRGVDGFRCDAGYKVPMPAWQYITAKVRQEFPDVVFLLEGLGGSWEATEALLTDGGMQWAYSELFQNYSPQQVSGYLDHAVAKSRSVGVLIHYSETHDNERLAAKGRAWSLLRNRLCALTSTAGGYGFTCGVEWLAAERINVHSSRGLAWGSSVNLVAELARLNRLLSEHPCFFDGASLTRLSPPDAAVIAILRRSADGKHAVLVLVNNDPEQPGSVVLDAGRLAPLGASKWVDLLGGSPPASERLSDGGVRFHLPAASACCLAAADKPQPADGAKYRRWRSQVAWGLQALNQVVPMEDLGRCPEAVFADLVDKNPRAFLSAVSRLDATHAKADLEKALLTAASDQGFAPVVAWSAVDARRVTPVPQGHWLLVQDAAPFRATLDHGRAQRLQHAQSIAVEGGFVACFPPGQRVGDARLILERYPAGNLPLEAQFLFLPLRPDLECRHPEHGLVLLTNGRGGMARLAVDLGSVRSKYDCALAVNLHPNVPVDRHVFAKRVRVWASAAGFISPLDAQNLVSFDAGPAAQWRFVANAGNGCSVEIQVAADMIAGSNATVFRFSRPAHPPFLGRDLGAGDLVSLTVRVDVEDRSFHAETRRNGGAEHHFGSNTHALVDRAGFSFTPAADRQLRVFSSSGSYHPEVEWAQDIPHPVEVSRGQVGSGDAFSPGWFELPLAKGERVFLTLTAEPEAPPADVLAEYVGKRSVDNDAMVRRAGFPDEDTFGRQLALAAHAFLVRRGEGRTVIAGYPWFLDWGRDSLICARGLVAAGLADEVRELLLTFARFEDRGTLPNTIHGEDASNRDTSDAPLWFAVACEDTAAVLGPELYALVPPGGQRPLREVLRSIAIGYSRGTPNGIRMDPGSGLVWSPSHFTWMDTNYPAGTPREGYPIEIQALWIRLLRLLERLEIPGDGEPWQAIADRAQASLVERFWIEEKGWFSDVLIARAGQSAAAAVQDDALRSNCLLAVSLGLATGDRARRTVEAALRHLVVPGALRSLAPLPVSPPLPIRAPDGRLLNDPERPYRGVYEGNEDTHRKPAYHNGTAWTWTFPVFCEALARAWDLEPTAVAAAKSYLGSMAQLLKEDCLGHLPEILDGDAPHRQRGCDAQAWSVTEALRVWKLLAAADRIGRRLR